jgi:hypothetical protein
MQKVTQYNTMLPKAIKSYTALLEEAIKLQINSPYERALDLHAVLRLPPDGATMQPIVDSPSQEDIAYTVHVIARVEAEIMFHDSKFSTGLYGFDFNRRVAALHVLTNEHRILTQQLAAIAALDKKDTEAEKLFTQETKTNYIPAAGAK